MSNNGGGRRPSTQFGEPLTDESLRLVREVRRQLSLPIHPNFDSDFNIYRFVASAERSQKSRKEVVEAAAKAVNQHLRVRKCLRLDELADVPFHRNRLFRDRFMPHGPILEGTDSRNRLLWFMEYRSLNVETIAHGMRSSESIRCQFWQFEHMLRLVNKREASTGRLSSIRHVVDMTGYEISPITMVFVSSGTLSYYSQLLHYDNYPELVYPIELVNIAKWVHIPYRLIKAMMPAGFADRFRLHDDNFLDTLTAEIPIEHIPHTLGGQNGSIQYVSARRLCPSAYWQPAHAHILDQLECLHIGPRKAKMFRIQIDEGGGALSSAPRHILSWYFRTDGDVFFGLFFEMAKTADSKENGHSNGATMNGGGTNKEKRSEGGGGGATAPPMGVEQMEAGMEWTYPLFKLTAKLHHEWDCVDCSRPGTYWLIFSNRHCWLHRRTVEVVVQLDREGEGSKRIWYDGAEEEAMAADDDGLRECLQMKPEQMYGPGMDDE